MRKTLLFLVMMLVVSSYELKAQTNVQVFYDLGKDRHQMTSTIEGFYNDDWGSTFFFIDLDYKLRQKDGNNSPFGAYMEFARALNFWKDSKLAPLSLRVEYNGGATQAYGIDHAFLTGVEYFMHSADFKNTLTLQANLKFITYQGSGVRSKLPMQFTAVWGMKDFLGVRNLSFSGFADLWWQEHTVVGWDSDLGGYNWADPKNSHICFLSEPQIWYNLGDAFQNHLNVGGELELSYDFGSSKGFWARPCLGIKWQF